VLQNHLQKFESFQLVAVCNNIPEATDALNKHQVDLIFLDIQLPGITGISFLRSLSGHMPLVIFTTAYTEYAVEAYELNVIDYLLKPISLERFSKAIDKVISLRSSPREAAANDHMFVRSNGKFFKINFSDIRYVEGMKDYLKIHTADHTFITHQTMSEMEKILPSSQFMRVHKSYLIAISHIKSIYGNTIDTGRITLPIGVNYKEKVMNLVERT